jgi:DNA-binding NtrC family response regulator
MSQPPRILVVDDDAELRQGLGRLLSGNGYAIDEAPDASSAIERALAAPPDLVIIDLDLPDRPGLGLLSELTTRGVEATMIVLTGHGSIDSAVEATRRGAFDYLVKPIEPERLSMVIERGLERAALRSEVLELRRQMGRDGCHHAMVGQSPPMLELFRLIDQVAPSNASVLIVGESGTGKELVARALHRQSPRGEKPFVALNCGAIPETLLESELFGHERGAFTGATSARTGCFEQADGGTLFLDEIGEMPPELQTKLLRVLEDGKVRRVGGSREQQVDIRVLAATNADIDERMREGKFREDLYFRLNVFTLRVPPLRERREDIPTLASHFLGRFLANEPFNVSGFSDRALDALKAAEWPGNVRQLRNAVHHAVILCGEGEVLPEHLPTHRVQRRPDASRADGLVISVGTSIADAERVLILETLGAYGGNKTRTADVLGISVKTLYTRLHAYGAFDPPEAAGASDAPEGRSRDSER